MDNTMPIWFRNGQYRLSAIPGHPAYIGSYEYQLDCDIVRDGKTILKAGQILKYPNIVNRRSEGWIIAIEYAGEVYNVPCNHFIIGRNLKEKSDNKVIIKTGKPEIVGVAKYFNFETGELVIQLSELIKINGKECNEIKVKLW